MVFVVCGCVFGVYFGNVCLGLLGWLAKHASKGKIALVKVWGCIFIFVLFLLLWCAGVCFWYMFGMRWGVFLVYFWNVCGGFGGCGVLVWRRGVVVLWVFAWSAGAAGTLPISQARSWKIM